MIGLRKRQNFARVCQIPGDTMISISDVWYLVVQSPPGGGACFSPEEGWKPIGVYGSREEAERAARCLMNALREEGRSQEVWIFPVPVAPPCPLARLAGHVHPYLQRIQERKSPLSSLSGVSCAEEDPKTSPSTD